MRRVAGFEGIALTMVMVLIGMLVLGPEEETAKWHDSSRDLPSDDSKTTTIPLGAAAVAIGAAVVIAVTGGSGDDAADSENDDADNSIRDAWDDEASIPSARTETEFTSILQVPVLNGSTQPTASGTSVQPLCGLGCDKLVLGVAISL
ncbi:MAG: hypothetical protein KAY32_08215 [Candidatus Eisenbacteria sp.]|nr:hypothetical protein [Candidatus Eisenbacteria bacterium]